MNKIRPISVIEPRQSFNLWLRDVWQFRNVLYALCLRDIRGKYKQAVLGIAWALVLPLVQVLLFTFIFRGIAGVKTPVPYPVFALAALLPYNLFQQIVSFGTPAFVSSQGIITKVYFPRFYTIIAGSASAFLNAAITVVGLIAVMIAYRCVPGPALLLSLPIIGGVVLLAFGVSAILAAINARFRDIQHALPLMLMILMYVSPVLYPLEVMPRRLQTAALLNPVSGLVDGFRSCVTGTAPFSWELTWTVVAFSFFFFVIGILIFERAQARLVDVL